MFIDWCTRPAVLFTAVDPGTTRIVVRLHSFETFSRWPYLTDFSRVDDVVFVGAHLRDLTVATVPSLRRPDAPALHVIPNAMDLERFDRPKEAGARFTLGLIGISAVAKDPLWSIAVLRLLRAHDERYRLFLIGADLDRELSAAARDYAARYETEVSCPRGGGSRPSAWPDRRRTGRAHRSRRDPQLLRPRELPLRARRRSCQWGCPRRSRLAVLRRQAEWGAHALSRSWLVSTPQEAADRIRAVTATEEAWRVAARDAADDARTTWGWPVVARAFDELLLHGASAPRAGGRTSRLRPRVRLLTGPTQGPGRS